MHFGINSFRLDVCSPITGAYGELLRVYWTGQTPVDRLSTEQTPTRWEKRHEHSKYSSSYHIGRGGGIRRRFRIGTG